MYKIDLELANRHLKLYTNCDNVKQYFDKCSDNIKKTLPITSINIDDANSIDIDKDYIILSSSNKKSMSYDKDNNICFLESPKDKIQFIEITYICLSMISAILERDNLYLVHSSVVKYDDENSIMLIGDGNSGKTSLAYGLIRDYNDKLISNDHTVIGFENDHIVSYGGTKELEMRYGMIKKMFPELNDLIKDNSNNDELWKQKVIINDYLKDHNYGFDDNSVITDIYQINTLLDCDAEFISKKDSIDKVLYLYEQVSKALKGGYSLITSFEYPMPSVETNQVLSDLFVNINNSKDNVDVYMAKGDLKKLIKKIGDSHAK